MDVRKIKKKKKDKPDLDAVDGLIKGERPTRQKPSDRLHDSMSPVADNKLLEGRSIRRHAINSAAAGEKRRLSSVVSESLSMHDAH